MSSDRWSSTSALYLTTNIGDAWATEAAEDGQRGAQRLIHSGEVPAPDDVAQALGLAPADPVIVRRRLMLLDERPVELTDSYYPASVAAGTPLAEPKKIPSGAVTLLANLGYRPDDVRETITARLPHKEEEDALDITGYEPVIILRRLSLANGRPFEYSVMTMRANGRHLHYRMST